MCVCVPLTRCRTVVEPVSPTVGMITRTSLKWRAALLARLRIDLWTFWRRGYAPNLFRCSNFLLTSYFALRL
jgi:hypothetical protein